MWLLFDVVPCLYRGFLLKRWKIRTYRGRLMLDGKLDWYCLTDISEDPVDSFLAKYHTTKEVSNGRDQGRESEFSQS